MNFISKSFIIILTYMFGISSQINKASRSYDYIFSLIKILPLQIYISVVILINYFDIFKNSFVTKL
jgi:hypothetical protein